MSSEAAKQLGRLGGKARAAKLTAEERSEACRKASRARWERKRANDEARRLTLSDDDL